MRKPRALLCALCLALMVPLLIRAGRLLPLDTRPMVAEKYAGWSGVLRLWVYEGWPCGAGTLSAWINACAGRFEKRHPGVYVQPRYVDAGAISSMNDSGILRPDMLLIPPRLLGDAAGLLPLATPEALRPGLARSGRAGDGFYAVPVAMGGYLWAWNAALIDGVPDSWLERGLTPAVPEPNDGRHWGAALLALCAQSPRSPADAEEPTPDLSLPGVELRLYSPEPAPSATPVASEASPCRLPESFQWDGDAWRRFVNGEAPALLVTQREIRRLQALSDRGRGPDWRLSADECPFTDQLLSLAVVDRPDAAAQQALCLEFLSCLLEDESQGTLCRAGAFGVTAAPSGYAAGDPLAILDAALRVDGLQTPRVLDRDWPAGADAIVREFISNGGDPGELWRQLSAILGKKPNEPERLGSASGQNAFP